MMTVTTARMQRADRLAAQRFGIPVLMLMENAGRAVADAVPKPGRVIVLCGNGNNGGDGVAAARTLHYRGHRVEVWWLKDPQLWKGSLALHYQMARRCGVRFKSFGRIPVARRAAQLRQADAIIDALLGTGTQGEIQGIYREAIEAINQARRPVVSIDLPSGLNADTGDPLGVAVRAKLTLTLAAAKKGLVRPSARRYVGKLIVVDIGIPTSLL
jgi:hydroxyethylthiazole kinase-like uncharacterized protein yjeF